MGIAPRRQFDSLHKGAQGPQRQSREQASRGGKEGPAKAGPFFVGSAVWPACTRQELSKSGLVSPGAIDNGGDSNFGGVEDAR